jgi:hypothetical protein
MELDLSIRPSLRSGRLSAARATRHEVSEIGAVERLAPDLPTCSIESHDLAGATTPTGALSDVYNRKFALSGVPGSVVESEMQGRDSVERRAPVHPNPLLALERSFTDKFAGDRTNEFGVLGEVLEHRLDVALVPVCDPFGGKAHHRVMVHQHHPKLVKRLRSASGALQMYAVAAEQP